MSLSDAQLKRCKEGKKTFGTQNMVNPKAHGSPYVSFGAPGLKGKGADLSSVAWNSPCRGLLFRQAALGET